MIEPTQIVQETDAQLSITWSDGVTSNFKASELRRSCPCATCVNEWTGEKILRDEHIDDGVTFADLSIVGRYALNFRFSDGHDTGIFSFKYLKEL